MNFLEIHLFNFVTKNKLKSQFSSVQYLSKMIDVQLSEEDFLNIHPGRIFEQLVKAPMQLELIQTFALMGWDDHQWKSHNGTKAMQNWWLSALQHEKAGNSLFLKVMVLRSILADTERYPAPTDLIQLMRRTLQGLFSANKWSHRQDEKLLRALISEDAKALASDALAKNKIVHQVVAEAGYPTKLPIIQEANVQWLSQWISASKAQRQILRQALNALLHQDLNIEFQCNFASIIFNHAYFSGDLKKLEVKVKEYPELVAWLSQCARQSEFKNDLNAQHRQALGIWVGTGNYESLRSILMDLAQQTEDEKDPKRTDSRYIFWKSYQIFFQEAWLLLPKKYLINNKKNLANVKEISGTEHATVVLKINNYFIFQYFLGSGNQVDLLMTDDVDKVEKILDQNVIFNHQLQQVNLILIHDHFFNWQNDLAYTLDKHFHVKAQGQKIYYPNRSGGYNLSNYLVQVSQLSFKEKRIQSDCLPKWVKNQKNRYNISVYNKAALTAQRYDLL